MVAGVVAAAGARRWRTASARCPGAREQGATAATAASRPCGTRGCPAQRCTPGACCTAPTPKSSRAQAALARATTQSPPRVSSAEAAHEAARCASAACACAAGARARASAASRLRCCPQLGEAGSETYAILRTFDFTPDKLRSGALVRTPAGTVVYYTKGSPEVIQNLVHRESLPAGLSVQVAETHPRYQHLLIPGAQCTLEDEHEGPHRDGGLIWHDPPKLVVGAEAA